MIVINMAVRCDITSVVYAIWLGTFLVLGRQNCSIVWPVYVGFLAVLLPLQYLLVLGWPPALCLGKKHRSFDQSFTLSMDYLYRFVVLPSVRVIPVCVFTGNPSAAL